MPKRGVRPMLVWLSFIWLAAIAGFFVWANVSTRRSEGQAPELVAAVDAALSRSVRDADRSLAERLTSISRLQGTESVDPLSLAPKVEGAEAFRIELTPTGDVELGYRGTSIANGICVDGSIGATGHISVRRAACHV